MKKKFCALILCICMCFTIFTGCSLFRTENALTSDTVIAKIYDKEITYADLQTKYATYSQYFAYYSEDIVMKIIYEEMYLNAIQEIKAEQTVVLYDEDIEEIFEDLYHNIVHVINDYEKTYIENDGLTAPSRLTEEDETESTKYEEYVFEPAEPITFDESKRATEPDFNERLIELKNEIFEGVESKWTEYRTKAWNKYVSNLIYSYKLQGKTYSADEAVIETIKASYKSLYKSTICTKYREYVESRVFGDMTYDEQIADVAMQAAIVNKYKELLNESKQNNTIEDNYTELVFSTTNTDLVLYHYEGKYTFFTVQHLLVKFDDDTLNILKTYEGYDKNKDVMFREEYEIARENFAYDSTTGTWVLETSYRDAEGNVVKVEKTDEHGEIVYETDEDGEFVLDANGEKIPVMIEAKITLQEISEKFETECAELFEKTLQERRTETGNSAYELTNDEKAYLRTNLFIQYIYMYTGDTGALGTDKLINTLGYCVSTDEDEDAGLMSEFADGARALYNSYINEGKYLGQDVSFVITDYGVHMMMLTGVYNKGEIVQIEGRTDAEIIEDLKNVKVSTFSNQTLFEYIYIVLKEEKVDGYYSKHLYEIFDKAQNEGKFVVYLEPTYSDLSGY